MAAKNKMGVVLIDNNKALLNSIDNPPIVAYDSQNTDSLDNNGNRNSRNQIILTKPPQRLKGINSLHFNALSPTTTIAEEDDIVEDDEVFVRDDDEENSNLDTSSDNQNLVSSYNHNDVKIKRSAANKRRFVSHLSCDSGVSVTSYNGSLSERRSQFEEQRSSQTRLESPSTSSGRNRFISASGENSPRLPAVPGGMVPVHHFSTNSHPPIPPFRNYLHSANTMNPSKSLSSGGSFLGTGSYIYSDTISQLSYPRSVINDATSIKSLASIGMGSTDGRRMVIRRVPTSPTELLNMINPPTPPDDSRSFDSSLGCGDHFDDVDSMYMKPQRREQWASKMQFVLACIGYSVGLGNVWRFPYLCYKSGGGVFLIPYFIILIVCGIPMLYMELAVGQFTGRGPIGALGHLCPIFKGAGVASVVISFLMSTYYSVIIAYAIYYLFAAFRPQAAWSHCSSSWNTQDCWIPPSVQHIYNVSRSNNSRTPSEEFFDHKVLKISRGIEEPGDLRWDLVACLLCAWVIVYFAIWKSIKSSAKVRYFTATFPFLLIIMFLGRAITLDGADRGLRYFFNPKWSLLLDAKVWVNAVAQNFNSLGTTFGSMICFASYNKYNNKILHDTLAVSFINAITSLLVGIFCFATIGNIATEQNTSIENVIDDGPGLVFVVYPQAMAKMPASQFWAVLFFFMMLCLGLNSQFAIVEVVVTSIQDGFPRWIRRNLVCHEMLVLVICVISFLVGLPNVTQGGIYYFQLIDHYAASISIMYLAFFESIAVAWFYGAWRLSKNVEDMTGKPPSIYFRFCWLILTPLLLLFLWVFTLIDYTPPTYDNGKYQYPDWAIALGWIIASLSLACIPGFAILVFCKAEGHTWREKLCKAILPDLFECKICGESNCEHLEKEQDETAELSPMLTVQMITKPEMQQSEIDRNEERKAQPQQNGTTTEGKIS